MPEPYWRSGNWDDELTPELVPPDCIPELHRNSGEDSQMRRLPLPVMLPML